MASKAILEPCFSSGGWGPKNGGLGLGDYKGVYPLFFSGFVVWSFKFGAFGSPLVRIAVGDPEGGLLSGVYSKLS